MKSSKNNRCESTLPKHVAIIMDGNGRWAKKRGLPRIKGHQEGAQSVIEAIKACRELGVEYLTLYAFSLENWKRPEDEISALMVLLGKFLKKEEKLLHKHRIRLRIIGRLADLPAELQNELTRVCEETAEYDDGNLTVALSYSGRDEMLSAVKKIARKAADGEIDVESIDEKTIAANLQCPEIPDPDLMIRTSGENRISNFLLWQLSYTELYFTDVLWPDFRIEHFRAAIEEYGCRCRRFGGI